MKKLLCILFVGLFIIFTACDNTNPPSPTPEPTIESQLALIKMPPEMLNKVFVSLVVDSVIVDYANSIPNLNTLYYGDGLVLCNPTNQDSLLAEFAQSQLNITSSSPYILLNNGYILIDWRWSRFQPLSGAFRNVLYYQPQIINHKSSQNAYSTNFYYLNGTLANEEYYVLPLQWNELKSLTTIWNVEEGQRIEKPEVRYINIKDIEKYGNCQKSGVDYFDENDLTNMYVLYSKDPNHFEFHINECNKWQALYVDILNQMIENNEFEKWTLTYENQ